MELSTPKAFSAAVTSSRPVAEPRLLPALAAESPSAMAEYARDMAEPMALVSQAASRLGIWTRTICRPANTSTTGQMPSLEP